MASGQSVRDTVLTSGLVATLLAPFIHFAVLKLEIGLGMALGASYEAQLLGGVVAVIQWGAAHYRSTQMQADDPA